MVKSKNIVFKYNDDNLSVALVSANAYQAVYSFRGNSPFDPDASGVSAQPYGWDQMAAIYQGYMSCASKITIYFNVKTITRVKAFLVPTTGATLAYTEPADLRATPYCKTVCYEEGGGATRHNKVTHYSTNKMMFPALDNNDAGFGALTTANPAAPWYWNIYFSSANEAVEGTVVFDVKIKYYCKMVANTNINES